jgi:hypothetical protein
MLPKIAKDALKLGKVDIRVMRSGTLQFQEFMVKRIPSPIGGYPVLFADKFVDMSELLRLAEEYQLPIMAKNGTVFPRGKTSKDFAGL